MNERTTRAFHARVSTEPTENGCFLWKGAMHTPDGYGYMVVGKRHVLSHRLAWEVYHGEPPPADLCVCHRCDTPKCVLEDHLFLGTIAENNRDCVSKKRHAYGSKSGRAKLNESAVREMRALYKSGVSSLDLAEMFGVARRTAQFAIAGKRAWRHVE